MNTKMRRLIVAGLLIAVAGCDRGQKTSTPGAGGKNGGPIEVEVAGVKKESLDRKVVFPATVRGDRTAQIYAKTSGFLKNVKVDIGDTVKKGDVLAEIDVPEMEKKLLQEKSRVNQARAMHAQAVAATKQAKAEMDSIEAEYDEAKTMAEEKKAMYDFRKNEYERMEILVSRGAGRKELLESAKFQFDSAKAGVRSAEAHVRSAAAKLKAAAASVEKAEADEKSALSNVAVTEANREYVVEMMKYSKITARYPGQITRRWFDSGAFIQSAEGNSNAKPIFEIASTEKVRVTVQVSMSEVNFIDRGDRAVLDRVDAMPGQKFDGTISRFSAGLKESSRMMQVEIDLDNSDQKLKPGYFGFVTLYMDQYKDVPVVASSAIQTGADEKHFLFVVENGKAVQKDIVVLFDDGNQAVIKSGVDIGESAITKMPSDLKNGDEVRAVAKN